MKQVTVGSVRPGTKVVYRGVLCVKANRRDSGVDWMPAVNGGWIRRKTTPLLVNISNGSLYSVTRDQQVFLALETGVACVKSPAVCAA